MIRFDENGILDLVSLDYGIDTVSKKNMYFANYIAEKDTYKVYVEIKCEFSKAFPPRCTLKDLIDKGDNKARVRFEGYVDYE